jgi:hypothetical protein
MQQQLTGTLLLAQPDLPGEWTTGEIQPCRANEMTALGLAVETTHFFYPLQPLYGQYWKPSPWLGAGRAFQSCMLPRCLWAHVEEAGLRAERCVEL